jgi:Na+/melibiose symporter-like transporter
MWARYVAFVGLYFIWVIGYTFQTSCTRSGQTVLTNDPQQRPLFTIFNTVGSLVGMGSIQFFAPILAKSFEGGYSSPDFFRALAPVGIVISIILTGLAIVGIWEKDQPKYFGIGGEKPQKIKVGEYIQIIKNNTPMQRLMVAGAGCKLALSIATNTTVLCMLYGCMMGNYDGMYLPMMVLGYVFSVPFFLLTVRTSQKKGQKASLMRYVSVALVMYVGVLVLLLMWKQGDPNVNLSFSNFNLYTAAFVVFFGIGYGAYYATADMPIPMVADCSDYETYRSGRYIPGIMGTLFSLVDKLVSSLSATVVGLAVSAIGLDILPTQYSPYTEGMNVVVIILFCIVPMAAWAATLIAMKGYSLTGDRMKEIQAVNAVRKDAIAKGMPMEEAMQKWTTIDQVPQEYLPQK